MRVFTNVRTNSRRIIGAAACAAIAMTLVATPASAESDTIEVTKTADVSSASAGDTVTYTVGVTHVGGLLSVDDDIALTDTLPPHAGYVAGSSTATYFNFLAHAATHTFNSANYGGGSGWAGDWAEVDDGFANSGGIQIVSTALRLRNEIGPDVPSISREIAVPAGSTAVNANITFGVLPVSVEGDDSFAVELSADGGPWQTVGSWTGATVPLAVSVDATGLDATTLAIRFVILSGTDASDNSCLPFPFDWICSTTLERFAITGLAVTLDTEQTWNDVGDPTVGPVTNTAWDIGYNDTLQITYQAVVDAVIPDETLADPTIPTVTTEVTNSALITSTDDPAGEGASVTLPLVRDPDFDIALSHNGPLQLGQPLTITAVVSHSDASDGFPLCGAVFQANVPDYEFTLLGGDDGDGCLEYSEEWSFAHTIPNMAAAVGLFNVEVGLFGTGPAEDTFESVHNLEYTVVLADTGATNTGLVLTALAFLVSGAAVLFLAAQRRRLG